MSAFTNITRRLTEVWDSVLIEWKTVLLVLVFPGLFFLIFKPFGLGSTQGSLFVVLVILGFGAVTALVTITYWIFLPRAFPQFFNKKGFGSRITLNTGFVVFLVSAIFLYKSYWEGFEHMTLVGFFIVSYRVIAIGFIPAVIITLWKRKSSINSNRETADRLNREDLQPITKLRLATSYGFLTVHIKDILFIQNADNYVKILQLKDGNVSSAIVRETMYRMEKRLSDSLLQRCHRSYIVNPDKVEKVSGNARGLLLTLPLVEQPIPVSRKYVKTIDSSLKKKA